MKTILGIPGPMNLYDSTVAIFLLLYGSLTVWAFYDIYQDDKMKTRKKALLILLVLVVPLFSSIMYFLWKGNKELDDSVFFNSH